MNGPSLRVGIAGLGTVGTVVAKSILDGVLPGVELTYACVRDLNKPRAVDLANIPVCTDWRDMVASDQVDLIVELIGGQDGPALDLARACLSNGKSLVTANKAMLAEHAIELAQLAEQQGQSLAYEAAVAGGIPIIKTVREALAGNRITKISGILNGTCNYILSEMADTGSSFDDILKQAQDLGYAEAEPSLDIDGLDAAQKLSLLAGICFGVKPNLDHIICSGIRQITLRDIRAARDFGRDIKLIALAENTVHGVRLWVGPCLIKNTQALANINGVTNAVQISAEPVGELILQGPGAGGGATASAVLGDIADLQGGHGRSLFARPVSDLTEGAIPKGQNQSAWYLRFALEDRPGIMAFVTQTLAEHGVSIEEVVQRAPDNGAAERPVLFITHKIDESRINSAVNEVKKNTGVSADMLILPVLDH